LTSARPQRPAISWDEALEIVRGESGTHYDPVVVEATGSEPILEASA
jgi:HD-GYP domain-containing protein (c-di-GMP phosphodiesterase class II)